MTLQTLARPERMPTEGEEAALEQFFQAVRVQNPFTDNRVNGPAPAELDVPNIHEGAYQRILDKVHEVATGQRAVGVLLWGEAGIGKSHLLARLGRWARENDRACFLYLHNLQASPENLPRALLRAIVYQLTLGQVRQLHRTPLFQLVLGLVSESLDHDTTRRHSWPKAHAAFERLLSRLAALDAHRAFAVERTIYEVLFRFFHSACQGRDGNEDGLARLVVRWLSGEYLDAADARRIGVSTGASADEPVALVDAEQIKQVLAALCRTAQSRGRPFVLCFDQVDNLDQDQIAAVARFLQALLDGAVNLIVVTSGVKDTLMRFREAQVIQASAWDRVADERIDLHRVGVADARRLVAFRLERFFDPFLELPEVRTAVQGDLLFPLGEGWAAEFLEGKIEVRPRDVMTWAREGWRREQERLHTLGGVRWLAEWPVQRPTAEPERRSALTAAELEAVIDQRVAEMVRTHQTSLTQSPDLLQLDADTLAGLLTALLKQCQHLGVGDVRKDSKTPVNGQPHQGEPYHLVLTQETTTVPRKRIGIRILCGDNASTTTAALRWITNDRHRPDRVLLVTEARRPLAFGRQPNARGRALYTKLQEGEPTRFQSVQLSVEEHAYLEALQEAVRQARVRELVVDLPGGQAHEVSESEVYAAHLHRGHYQASALLRNILSLGPVDKDHPS